jgi:hypothetical protein
MRNSHAQEEKTERLKRGSNPPYIGLGDAFALIRGIYEQGGGQASYDLLSRLTGNSRSSSSFIKKIGALKAYGLVTEQSDTVYLTEYGQSIAAPTSESGASSAKRASLLSVGVFAKIYERHKGKLLPADEFLKNIIEQDSGIPRDLSSEWTRAFKEAARAAGILYDRPDGKTQIMEGVSTDSGAESRSDSVDSASVSNRSEETPRSVPSQPIPHSSAPSSASGNVTRFELSDGRIAEFNIPFGINSRDAKRLKSYLEGLKLIIDAAVSDEEDSAL